METESKSFYINHRTRSEYNTIDLEVNIKNNETRDSLYKALGYINIKTVDPSIQVDLKYASNDNFLHKKLYTRLDKAYVQKEVAFKLKKAQEQLKSMHAEYSLVIYDATRPVSVQKLMWEALDSIPVPQRVLFVSNPVNKSLHNYGAAVDLTILDAMGIPLDMGAGYDDPRKIAYPSMETVFYKKGLLSEEHMKNRKLLRSVMQFAEFRQLPSEWWHFNSCNRAYAQVHYHILEEEY